jgi:transcriptional regulator with XRE-family HTH domain
MADITLMMQQVLDGARAHRRLRLALRDRRRRAGLTHREVADSLEWSVSKIVRIENGDVRLTPSDLRNLLRLYGDGTHAEHDEDLLNLARQAKNQPWRAFSDVHAPAFLRFLAYESTASRIWHVQPQFVPGLFHTRAYAEAVLSSAQLARFEPAVVDRIWEARAERQKVLHVGQPPLVTAYIDESALLRAVGGPLVMHGQLMQLAMLAELPHITIRVVPLRAGAYPGIRNAFVRLAFTEEQDPDVLYVEGVGGDVVLRDDPDGASTRGPYDLDAYISALDFLDAVALPEGESLAQVLTVANSFASTAED